MRKHQLHSILPSHIKSCAYCAYMKSYVTWWCGNDNAIELHNTAIPKPFINCQFFEIDVKYFNSSKVCLDHETISS